MLDPQRAQRPWLRVYPQAENANYGTNFHALARISAIRAIDSFTESSKLVPLKQFEHPYVKLSTVICVWMVYNKDFVSKL